MSGSRANRRHPAATVAAVAAAAFFATLDPTFAQSRAPVSLIPPTVDKEDTAPGVPQRPPVASETVRPIPGTGDSGVEIRDLGTVDTEAVGVTGQSAVGLTTEMWRGTSRAVAERLLAAMPERLASGAAQELARSLLLVAAEPPASARGDTSLVKLRVDKLIALGATEDAARLLQAVSARSVPNNLVESAVRARLLTGDYNGACQAVEAANIGFVSEFGQKALIFCQLLAQEFSEAVLGLELLREQNLAQDATFFEFSNALISGAPPTEEQLAVPGQASALNLALVRVAGSPVPVWFADADQPSVLKAVAVSPSAERETRLIAARRAAQWGALPPAELADVYTNLGISADEVATVLLEPEVASPGLRLAAMYLAANNQTLAVARAEVLREVWHLASAQRDWRLVARLTGPLLSGVRPVPAFSWFAGDAMAASLAAGQVEQALEWFEIASGRSGVDEDAAKALTAMWPALRMAAGGSAASQTGGPQVRVFDQSGRRNVSAIPGATSLTVARRDPMPWDERRLAEWIALQEANGPQGVAAIATTLALFDGLGEEVAEAFWLRAEAAEPASAGLPPVDVWVGLQRAADAGKVAETALYALLTVSEGEFAQLHPVAIHSIVAALRRVGLSAAARQFALEIAVTAAR